MGQECAICNIIEGKVKLEKVYEDKDLIAVIPQKPAAVGHVIVFPKKHYTIIEQVPDYEIPHIFDVVNKISVAVFEATGSAGTNILVQNGVAAGQSDPHLSIHIIPRKEGDGIDFQWKPKQLTQEQMSHVESKVKEGVKDMPEFETEKKKEPVKIEKKAEEIKQDKEKENYLIKQLERIP